MLPSLKNGFPPFIVNLLDELNRLIGPIHLVGSAVRNVLQGCPLSNDLNILTPRPLDQCLESLRQAGHDAVGGGSGDKSIFVPLKGWEKPKTIEISKFRHRPAQSPTVEEDLLHRDITVNAMAYAWADGPLIDPFNGRGDLASGRIRLVNGLETLKGDPLRAIRLFRFSLQLTATPNPSDLQSSLGISLDQVPPERIRVELDRIFSFPLETPQSRELLFTLFDSNLGMAMLPELKRLDGITLAAEPRGATVWRHTLNTVVAISHSPREEDISLLDLRWATILAGLVFHAKELRQRQPTDPGGGQEKSIQQITTMLNRLGFSKRRQKKILFLLNNLHLSFPFSDRALRRLLGESVPIEGLVTLIFHWKQELLRCTAPEECREQNEYSRIIERCRGLRRASTTLGNGDLALSGGDLREIVRRRPGPWLGQLQRWLLDWIGEDRSRNTPDAVRKKVIEWISIQEKL
ncbi:MAG: CCA tRNA nucleotidyltransferase [Magnetococcales bacterium]|nr:CCA tRNA nucleotidyltransferase [Magnetococcales bacterium]